MRSSAGRRARKYGLGDAGEFVLARAIANRLQCMCFPVSPSAGVRIYLACGVTDMRRGFDSLSILASAVLKVGPFPGHLFAFRGRRGHLMKILYWDGRGICLFA